jgi:hypothetical protein
LLLREGNLPQAAVLRRHPAHVNGPFAACAPCEPGQTVSLSALILPDHGTAVYRGQTYLFDLNTGGAVIGLESASLTLPPGSGTESTIVEFEAPFTVANGSVLTLQSGFNGEIQQILALSGSGTTTIQLVVYYDPGLQTHLYSYESIRYDFSKNQKSNE